MGARAPKRTLNYAGRLRPPFMHRTSHQNTAYVLLYAHGGAVAAARARRRLCLTHVHTEPFCQLHVVHVVLRLLTRTRDTTSLMLYGLTRSLRRRVGGGKGRAAEAATAMDDAAPARPSRCRAQKKTTLRHGQRWYETGTCDGACAGACTGMGDAVRG